MREPQSPVFLTHVTNTLEPSSWARRWILVFQYIGGTEAPTAFLFRSGDSWQRAQESGAVTQRAPLANNVM